ncbi:ABC transporter substrate-binding protein [Leptospira interrogans]
MHRPAHAKEAQAADGPPLDIAILISSRNDVCYDPGDVAAIKRFSTLVRDRLNRGGGIGGRRIVLKFLDDEREAYKTVANVRSAVSNPDTLAIVGLSNSNRAKEVFDTLGDDIRKSRIPFLSDITVNSIFENSPNVLTMRASQDADRVPVMTQFIMAGNYARPAFVGLSDMVFSASFGDGLKETLGANGLVADHRLQLVNDAIVPDEVSAMVADLKAKQPDLLIMSIGSRRLVEVAKQLMEAGVAPALFVTGRIDALPPEFTSAYPNSIYQLAWDRLPELYSDRLRSVIDRDAPEAWVLEGRKIDKAPGWAKGECTPRPENDDPDPLTDANMRAIGVGTQFADMVALIAATARTAPVRDIASLRTHVMKELTTTYASGRGAFKGAFENWSFDSVSRSASRTPFIVMLPRGLGRTQLAPIQFVRLRDGLLRRVNTLYLDIDMIRAQRVEDSQKTFFAEFYLSMRANETASIEQLEFTNAYLDPETNSRQISIDVLHNGGDSDAYPYSMKIYKVAGRFVFDPDLSNYPFDTQRFSIDLQPKRGDAPFIVQPPPLSLRDRQIETDGWEQKSQYVGYDEDFIPLLDAYTHQPSVVPFYKASYVWLMNRQTTDYVFRVIVPLAFILIVAYLSIFIPSTHFEAIVTIQVTALLSAVALYLAIPQLGSDAATLSDRLFVFDYMMVSFMIVISILRINKHVANRKWLFHLLGTIHVVAVPIMVILTGYYVYYLSLGGQSLDISELIAKMRSALAFQS